MVSRSRSRGAAKVVTHLIANILQGAAVQAMSQPWRQHPGKCGCWGIGPKAALAISGVGRARRVLPFRPVVGLPGQVNAIGPASRTGTVLLGDLPGTRSPAQLKYPHL